MEIVQLSDLHIGAQFREEVFGNVIDEINSLKPEAVVITGDLTNEGLIEQNDKVVLFNCASGLKYPLPEVKNFIDKNSKINFSDFKF